MHLVCLGAVKKMIHLWLRPGGPLSVRIRARAVKDIIKHLVGDIYLTTPTEFQRKSGALEEFCM